MEEIEVVRLALELMESQNNPSETKAGLVPLTDSSPPRSSLLVHLHPPTHRTYAVLPLPPAPHILVNLHTHKNRPDQYTCLKMTILALDSRKSVSTGRVETISCTMTLIGHGLEVLMR